jgi:small subunit ribosomal protein S14
MKHLIVKDQRRRRKVFQFEFKQKCYRFLKNNHFLNYKKRWFFNKSLDRLPKDCSIVRISNRCVITGRGRSVYSKYKLSRIFLRNFILNKQLVGLQKSSW